MIDFIIKQLFKWQPLRLALFDEVNMYNSITRILADPEEMKIAAALWDDRDGWRGWTIRDDGRYYFHDIPEHSINDIMDILMEREAA